MTESAGKAAQVYAAAPNPFEGEDNEAFVASFTDPREGLSDEVVKLQDEVRLLRAQLSKAVMDKDEAVAAASRDRHRMNQIYNGMNTLNKANAKLAAQVKYHQNEIRIHKAWCECDSTRKADNRNKRAANITDKEIRNEQRKARDEAKAAERETAQNVAYIMEMIRKKKMEDGNG